MKYKLLSPKEFQQLRPTFAEFLAARGLTPGAWEQIIQRDNERAKQLLEDFSDRIWESRLQQLAYLEHQNPTSIRIYHCKEKQVIVNILEGSAGEVDFSQPDSLDAGQSFKVEQQEQFYPAQERNAFIFDLIKLGARPSSKQRFEQIAALAEQ